jgi:threonine dehydrogenase-like Zn-dependent dehydrogenase
VRAAGLDYDRREVVMREMAEPGPPGAGEVLLRVHEVGVCGTDRELARFRFGEPPAGERFLTLGHEALARVAAAGPGVENLKDGDWVVPAIRRSCPINCLSCARGRRDLCLSGGYRERGITLAHGYFCDWTLDAACDLIRVPDGMLDVAVLAEPLSVVEKAIERARGLHAGEPRSALVLGAGPIGLLGALALRTRGYAVEVLSLEPEDSPRARWLRSGGIRYRRENPAPADLIFEAAGSAAAAGLALERLAPLGVLIILGAPEIERFPAGRLIGDNQTIAGVVNAGPEHFRMALDDLARFDRRMTGALIERRGFPGRPEDVLNFGQTPKLVHVLAE